MLIVSFKVQLAAFNYYSTAKAVRPTKYFLLISFITYMLHLFSGSKPPDSFRQPCASIYISELHFKGWLNKIRETRMGFFMD